MCVDMGVCPIVINACRLRMYLRMNNNFRKFLKLQN